MLRKLFYRLIIFSSIFLISCASFAPGVVEYHSAITSPYSQIKDSVFVYVKEYTNQEGKLIFDTNFQYYYFKPLYISIYNQSSSPIIVDTSNIDNFVNIDKIYKETKSGAPFDYFLLWSTPWAINIGAGLPFYYGIAWPVFGLIAMSKSKNANERRGEYYSYVSLKPTRLFTGQETDGVVFVNNNNSDIIYLSIVKEDSTTIHFKLTDKNRRKF